MSEKNECLWLTIWMLTSGPELSSSNLIIACLLCHNQLSNSWLLGLCLQSLPTSTYPVWPLQSHNLERCDQHGRATWRLYTKSKKSPITLNMLCTLKHSMNCLITALTSSKVTIQTNIRIVINYLLLNMTPSNTVLITNEILNVIHQYKSCNDSQVKYQLQTQVPVTISSTSYNLRYQLQSQVPITTSNTSYKLNTNSKLHL